MRLWVVWALVAARAGAAPEGECAACTSSAARTELVVPPVLCAPGAPATLGIVARDAHGRRVTAGGDAFTATLCEVAGCVRGEAHALRVLDGCDGSYTVSLPCAVLRAGRWQLSVELSSAHLRATLEQSLWYCAQRAAVFTAWDELSYEQLRDRLFECPGAPALERTVTIGASAGGSARARARPAAGCAAAFARAAAAHASSGGGAQPVLAPCAPDRAGEVAMLFEPAAFHHCPAAGDDGCALLPTGAPPSCLAGTSVAFLGDSVVEGTHLDIAHMWAHAQRGPDGAPLNRLAFGGCAFDRHSNKWVARVRKNVPPILNVSACARRWPPERARACGWFDARDCEARDEGALAPFPPLLAAAATVGTPSATNRTAASATARVAAANVAVVATRRAVLAAERARDEAERACAAAAGGDGGGGVGGARAPPRASFAFGDFRLPFRRGLANYARFWPRLLGYLRNFTIVVIESGRHDLADALQGGKRRVLGAYRAGAHALAIRIARAVAAERLRVRVVFRTMLAPPTFGTCAIAANLPAVAAIANAAAARAFSARRFAVLPLHVWGTGAHHPRWWPTAVYSDYRNEHAAPTAVRDVHTHEGWCPRARLPTAESRAVEQLGHRYGWLSKALTQLSVHALCWPDEALRTPWPGPPAR